MKPLIFLIVALLIAPLSYAHSRYDRGYDGHHRHYNYPNARYYQPPPPPVRYYANPPVRYYAPPPAYFAPPPAVVYPAPPNPYYRRGYSHW